MAFSQQAAAVMRDARHEPDWGGIALLFTDVHAQAAASVPIELAGGPPPCGTGSHWPSDTYSLSDGEKTAMLAEPPWHALDGGPEVARARWNATVSGR